MTANPETIAFLERNPLPPDIAHLRPVIVKLPVPLVLGIVARGVVFGCAPEEIDRGLHLAADFADQERHRCACCFYWHKMKDARPLASIVEDNKTGERTFRFISICDRCSERIDNGTATEQMRENLLDYLCGK